MNVLLIGCTKENLVFYYRTSVNRNLRTVTMFLFLFNLIYRGTTVTLKLR